MAAEVGTSMADLPASLTRLNDELDNSIHLLATDGNEVLAQTAFDAAQACFELGKLDLLN